LQSNVDYNVRTACKQLESKTMSFFKEVIAVFKVI